MIVCLFVCLLVFNVTLNNTSVIPWRSVLLVEKTGYTRKNYRPAACHLTNCITLCGIEYTACVTPIQSSPVKVFAVIEERNHLRRK